LSLTGNLEDLPLLDIIQIVSFSKKTGYLTIRQPEGESAIVFAEGHVVASYTWDSPPADARVGQLAPDKREKLIRGRLELALERLIRLREGEFSFNLTEQAPKAIGPRSLEHETLRDGINPQELLLDLARGMDEDRRDSTAALEASFAEESFESPADAGEAGFEESFETVPPAAPAPATDARAALAEIPPDHLLPPPSAPAPEPAPPAPPPAAAPPRTLLLVEDEADIREALAERFREAGHTVLEAEDVETAVKAATRIFKGGGRVALVTDLTMPTTVGSSFQGGLEVAKRVKKLQPDTPVLLMTESLPASAKERAKNFGITHIVFKPGLSRLDPEQFAADLRAFGVKLVKDVVPKLLAPPRPKPAKAAGKAAPAGADLKRLQQRMEELRHTPAEASQIAQLVMSVAADFFERGVLFLVKGEELRGLGGFGPVQGEDNVHLVARGLVLPLAPASAFHDVVEGRRTVTFPPAADAQGARVLAALGAFASTSAALLPLVTHREVVAVLMGDHPVSGRAPEGLEMIELFLHQAGVALENAFLQKKIAALQG
jgi:CheY-like chemotaxis protein